MGKDAFLGLDTSCGSTQSTPARDHRACAGFARQALLRCFTPYARPRSCARRATPAQPAPITEILPAGSSLAIKPPPDIPTTRAQYNPSWRGTPSSPHTSAKSRSGPCESSYVPRLALPMCDTTIDQPPLAVPPRSNHHNPLGRPHLLRRHILPLQHDPVGIPLDRRASTRPPAAPRAELE